MKYVPFVSFSTMASTYGVTYAPLTPSLCALSKASSMATWMAAESWGAGLGTPTTMPEKGGRCVSWVRVVRKGDMDICIKGV